MSPANTTTAQREVAVSITVNGTAQTRTVDARTLLVHFLREDLGLTGTHVGCDTSNCGACTVHLGGEAVKSCTILAVQADGTDVTTIEGVAPQDGLDFHPVQQGFHECHGLQCGYCTPGMVMACISLLNDNPDPSDPEIRLALEGNLCRCTGYQMIVDSVRWAADHNNGRTPHSPARSGTNRPASSQPGTNGGGAR